MIKVSKKYWQIAKRLTTAQLQKESSEKGFVNETDLFNINIGKRGHDFFLGYYSKEGLELAFEKYGIFDHLRGKGFKNLIFNIETNDPYVHRLTIHNQINDMDHLLIELVLKKKFIQIDVPFETKLNGKRIETLAIEWLCLQNPQAQFGKDKPKLPGQRFPGLGMASRAVELLIISAWRLNLAGLVNTPEHFHNAHLYSRIFFYLNPDDQAKLMALARDTAPYELHEVAWAIEWGLLKQKESDEPFRWFVAEQIVPLDEKLKNLFNSAKYRKLVKKGMQQFHFTLDYKRFLELKKEKQREIYT